MGKSSKSTFDALLNQRFMIHSHDETTIPLRLTSITSHKFNDQFESFTLNFDPVDDAAALPDGTYILENDQMGQADIFISATPVIGPKPGRYYYEAVFNVYVGDNEDQCF